MSAILLSFALVGAAHAQDAEPWRPDPDQVERLGREQNDFNYDEAKVPEYELPNPLLANDGTMIDSRKSWDMTRRDELMEHFRAQVYGRRPSTNFTATFAQQAEVTDAFDGAATGRSMICTITIGERKFEFPFVIFFPNDAPGKVPGVVQINNRYFVPLDKAIAEEDEFWPVKKLIENGYATASFFTSDVDPDDADGYADGVRSFFAEGKPPEDDAWGSLSAWGWAASRVMDYVQNVPQINPSRVAVAGHSRGGKTALWAACEDTRFAIAYSNESGCGGAALSRRQYGETVGRITSAFPHWFCKNFSAYSGREQELPIDQHEVVALIAPRAVYVSSASEDLWADPKGEYSSLLAAAPVYQLLGEQSITNPEMPPLSVPRIEGSTGYHIRPGEHGWLAVDWQNFMAFADTQLK